MRVLERAYTLVTGPAGGGKTSLIERLVASNRSRWLGAVRVLEDGVVDEAVEDEELPYGLNPGNVVEESEEAFESEVLNQLPDEVGQSIVRLLEEGRPLVRRKHWLRRGWEALAEVDLVVIPTSGPGGSEAAQRLAAEIAGVRRDDELRREVASLYGWPRSWQVADLRDPRDAGTVKVVQAVKRRWRSAFGGREPLG